MPEIRLSVSNTAHYTLEGKDLLEPNSIVDHTGEYLCEMLLYNSGDIYRLGHVFLKNYYTVYDIDNFKFALGPVVDFDYEEPIDDEEEEEGSSDADGTDSVDDDQKNPNKRQPHHDNLVNGLVFGVVALIFTALTCYACKRRNDAERLNSGS